MNNRITFIDYVRVAACFMVMLVHASENFYGADSSGLAGPASMLANEANRFWVSLYDGAFGRISVPLFMIVSAFLLAPMKEGETMMSFYRKRFMRILPPFLFFMLLYTFLPLCWGGMTLEQSLKDFSLLPFNFPSMGGHLWFMYPLISLYLIIPVVSPWLEKASAKEELIFIGLFALSTFTPWIHRFITPEIWGECFWNGFSALWYCSGFLGYLVLAHFVRKHLAWSDRKKMAVGAVCFAIGAAFTAWSFYMKGIPGQLIETPMLEWAWEFCTPNVLCATFGAFLMFTCTGKKPAPALVTDVSKKSYGMYLVHMFYLVPVASFIINGNQAEPLLPVWAAIPLIAVITYVCSYLTIKLLSYLPGSRYIVG